MHTVSFLCHYTHSLIPMPLYTQSHSYAIIHTDSFLCHYTHICHYTHSLIPMPLYTHAIIHIASFLCHYTHSLIPMPLYTQPHSYAIIHTASFLCSHITRISNKIIDPYQKIVSRTAQLARLQVRCGSTVYNICFN